MICYHNFIINRIRNPNNFFKQVKSVNEIESFSPRALFFLRWLAYGTAIKKSHNGARIIISFTVGVHINKVLLLIVSAHQMKN
jgi:hypothetical protein